MMWLHRLLTRLANWWLEEICYSCWRKAFEDGRCYECEQAHGRES